MRINPMNTMSFQAKIRPGNKPIEATNNINILQNATALYFLTNGSALASNNPSMINLMGTTTPEIARQITDNPHLAGAFSIGTALSTAMNSFLLNELEKTRDPSESKLTKDDINIEEK